MNNEAQAAISIGVRIGALEAQFADYVDAAEARFEALENGATRMKVTVEQDKIEPEPEPEPGEIVMYYKNYRGETSRRRIKPVRVYWGTTEWHPTPCFLLHAWDYEKNAVRDFELASCCFDLRWPVVVAGWNSLAQHTSIDSGVCMCGQEIENHPTDDHSPSDSGNYAANRMKEATKKLLGS